MDKDHLLSRLDIQLNYNAGGSEADGTAVADRLADEVFIPILESVIDEYPPSIGRYIDSITVQVPPVQEKDLPAAFEKALREALSEAIPDFHYAISDTYPPSTVQEEIYGLKYLLSPDNAFAEDSDIQSIYTLLLHIMQRSESFSSQSPVALHPVAETSEPEAVSQIQAQPHRSEGFAPEDLIPEFAGIDTSFLGDLSLTEQIHLFILLEQTGPKEQAPFLHLKAVLCDIITAQDARVLPALQYRLSSWREYLSARKESQEERENADPTSSTSNNTSISSSSSSSSSTSPTTSTTSSAASAQTVIDYPIVEMPTEGETVMAQSTDIDEREVTEEVVGDEGAEINEELLEERRQVQTTVETSENAWNLLDNELPVQDSRYYVKDAGLTLLHPFIGLFLKNMGLVKDGEFISPQSQVYAVHLLRELVWPGQPHYNHNLVLEKILCGLPPDYTVPEEWEPDQASQEESEALLKAVCGHWKPLSKSSTNALRTGFLQRQGSVVMEDGTWIVRVEGSAMDVLLDSLPWELSFIIFPWNEKPVLVEWLQESDF